jgi:hypothetical protein
VKRTLTAPTNPVRCESVSVLENFNRRWTSTLSPDHGDDSAARE